MGRTMNGHGRTRRTAAVVGLALAMTLFSGGSLVLADDASSTSADGEQTSSVPQEVLDQNASTAKDLAALSTMPESQRGDLQQEINDVMDSISERAYENLPTITTLEDGTKIQRTPATPDNNITGNLEYTYEGWNTIYLDSDRRGCNACHSDLAELVENMSGEPHTNLANNLGIDVQVRQCVDCHSYCTVLYDKSDKFGTIMHSLHGTSNQTFTNLGGDCWSCHYVDPSGSYDQGTGDETLGTFQLWDNVKYDLWRGISKLSAEDIDATFTYDQDYTLPAEDLFNKNFFYEPSGGVARKLAAHTDATPDPTTDGIYDTWEIEVSGDGVGNPFTMTIQEMIDTFGLDTDTITICCDAGPVGSNLIGNFEIKGIDVRKIMDYAQVSDATTILDAFAPNGHNYQSLASDIREKGAYLVLEVAGEPLPYQSGYPVQLWIAGASAWCDEKEVVTLEFQEADLNDKELFPDWFFNQGITDASGHSSYKPTVGFFNLKDGQVIDYEPGQAINFSGFAYAYMDSITSVEYSLDGGQTWLSFETADTTCKNWVHWTFDWTPPDQGAYVLQLRATDSSGVTTAEPLKFLLNVQSPDNPTDVAAAVALQNSESDGE